MSAREAVKRLREQAVRLLATDESTWECQLCEALSLPPERDIQHEPDCALVLILAALTHEQPEEETE